METIYFVGPAVCDNLKNLVFPAPHPMLIITENLTPALKINIVQKKYVKFIKNNLFVILKGAFFM